MADLLEVNKRIRTLIRTLLAMPENSVRRANQTAPTGSQSEQFATVFISWINRTGWDDLTLKNQIAPSLDVDETVVGQRHLSASIQFFRGDAYTKAQRLEALLQTSKAISAMQAANLGLVRIGQARNITGLVDTYWEERGQIDIEFHVIADEITALPTFGRFPIQINTETEQLTSEVFEP